MLMVLTRVKDLGSIGADGLGGGLGHAGVESAKYVALLNMLHPADCNKRSCRCPDGIKILVKGKIFGSEEI